MRRWLLAILAVAVLGRILVFVQMADGPAIHLHRWQESDMAYFHDWAVEVAGGDLLSRSIAPPHHGWHRAIADVETWQRWCGGGRFYQEPLYVYAIAATYALFGDRPLVVFGWQLLLGLASILLLYDLSRRLFGETTAGVAAAIAALTGPILFYEMTLVRASAIAFVGLLLVWLLDRARETERPPPWVAAGLVAGLAVALKSIFLLLFLVAVASLLLERRRNPALWLVLGLALGLSPFIARNLAVDVPPFGLSSAGGVNFVVANARSATESSAYFADADESRRLIEAGGGKLLASIPPTLATHDVASLFDLASRKGKALLGRHELPNNTSFAYYRHRTPVLRWWFVGFGLIGPLGLAGLALAWRRTALPLYVLVATHVLALLGFFVYGRMRLPLMVALIPFAAVTLTRTIEWARRRRWAPLAGVAVAVVAVAAAGWSPARSLVRAADHVAAFTAHYAPEAERAMDAGDPARAAEILGRFLDDEPQRVRALDGSVGVEDRRIRSLAFLYGRAHFERSKATSAAGRPQEAAVHERRARELAAAVAASR